MDKNIKTISAVKESKDTFKIAVEIDGREYSDRFSLTGLRAVNKKSKSKDKLQDLIRVAFIKAAENLTEKKETQDARKTSE